jgi:hypothetical protein
MRQSSDGTLARGALLRRNGFKMLSTRLIEAPAN